MTIRKPIVLIRPSLAEEEEVKALEKLNIPHTTSRTAIPPESLVVGRYSVLPYYKELQLDLEYNKSTLVNSVREHKFIADVGAYAYELQDLTPKTWTSLADVPKDMGSLVLKGATNSKKHQWRTHMFAKDWDAAVQVFARLCEDTLIGSQQIYIRQYVPLVSYGETITGLPITKEFRFFVFKEQIVASNFYWTDFAEDIQDNGFSVPSIEEVPVDFLKKVTGILKDHATFYVIDVAQDTTGKWWVVDVNDAQMSGLSGINPENFYRSLWEILEDNLIKEIFDNL